MPDGVLQWFDPATGDAAVVRGGRVFAAGAADVETAARHAGARVHFDVREDGAARAVNVTLRRGTRVSRRQNGFGTLVGARRPDTKGSAPFARPHPELGLSLASHPLEVASTWARCLREGDLDVALSLYAPDARLHVESGTISGRRHLTAYLESSVLLGLGAPPEVRGDEGIVVLTWRPPAGPPQGLEVRCRIEHGRVAEQWVADAPTPPTPVSEGGEGEAAPIQVVAVGAVDEEALDYARRRLGAVITQIGEPVLFARVKLTLAGDPARERPAIAQVAVDVDGEVVRAQVAATDLREAVDLLQRRLRDQLGHRATRVRELRRSSGIPELGEWRHGDLPSARPGYFDRPLEERRLVRHKSFAIDELTPDEAAFDMDQLDYDFHLFRDLASGEDTLLERLPEGTLQLTRLHPTSVEAGPSAVVVTEAIQPPPTATVSEAIDMLDDGNVQFLFFANATTGRGNVVYHRYDGHYGLITPE